MTDESKPDWKTNSFPPIAAWRWRNSRNVYDRGDSGVVCFAQSAVLQSSKLGIWTGVDSALHPYGHLTVPDLETGIQQTARSGDSDFYGAADFEFRMEFPLFLLQANWSSPNGNNCSLDTDSINAD